jgi:glycosyltransferase involved in cell wall biosynthesis
MPDVSVVVPTRDRRRFLRLALLSVLRQRGVDIEVIVVDDASTDDSAEMVTALADHRVRLFRHDTPRGVSTTRNRGIAEASGDWIAFLDDDDVWAPEKLVRQLEVATRSSRAWVYTGDVNIDDHLIVLSAFRPPTPEQVMEGLPRYNPISSGASNVVARADALADAGPFDPGLRRIQDWDMWIRLARTGPPACVSRPLVGYRFHASNAAVDTRAIVEEPDLLAARYGIPVDRAAMHRQAAWAFLRAGDRGGAIRHYARAVSMGDLKSVARAAVALLHPAAGSNRVFGLLRGSLADERWRADAQAWLDELSRLQASFGGPSPS